LLKLAVRQLRLRLYHPAHAACGERRPAMLEQSVAGAGQSVNGAERSVKGAALQRRALTFCRPPLSLLRSLALLLPACWCPCIARWRGIYGWAWLRLRSSVTRRRIA